METRQHRLWHTVREYLTHWSIAGAILAATGAAPEHWFAELAHEVHFPHGALPPWLEHVDYRLVAVMVGLSIIVGDNLLRNHGRDATVTAAPALQVRETRPVVEGLAPPRKPTVAVLAFSNMSGDIDQEYFSDGIAEDIITQLSRSTALLVIARNSSFTYKGQATDVKQIGRDLGVRYVLEGSVRRDKERVRINAQLIETYAGNHIWVERFDRAVTDIFAVQDEIADAVALAIEPAITRVEQQRISRRQPETLDAWEAYQRGLWHFNKTNAADNTIACEFFLKAIRLDPMFTSPYVELAMAYIRAGAQYRSVPLRKAVELAIEHAQAALTIDNANGEAYMALGAAFFNSGDPAAAAYHFEQALSINPNSIRAHRYKALLLIFNGRPAEGRAALLRHMRLDPLGNEAAMNQLRVAISFYLEGNYNATIDAAERCIAVYPGLYGANYFLAAALGQLGRRTEAEAGLRRATQLSPESFQFYVTECPPWMRPEDNAKMLEGLRKAGWDGLPSIAR